MKKTWSPEYKRKEEDLFERACEKADKNFGKELANAGYDGAGRFPGVEDDGVAVPKRQSTDIEFHGGINSTFTHGPVAWSKPPTTEEEKAIYYGFHVHDSNNPFGLHSHVLNGKLSGGHTHGPENRTGKHTHKEIEGNSSFMIQLSGDHTHKEQFPDGGHTHPMQDFG